MRLAIALVLAGCAAGREQAPWPGITRVLFLGDSITYDGKYVSDIEACLRANEPARELEVLNLGLPSETVSGLSEPDHAGGAFPRPVLSKRLARVFAATRPELVVACYGMNDGIYLPFDEQRCARFQAGIEGLRESCKAAGAQLVLLTPPVYDGHGPVDYDAVLQRYSDWLVGQRSQGWVVVDVHAAMKRALAERRRTQPGFTFSADGVHPEAAGHWMIARSLLEYLGLRGLGESCSADEKLVELVRTRQEIERDSGLTSTGHRRPGLPAGLPPEEARARASALEAELRARLSTPNR